MMIFLLVLFCVVKSYAIEDKVVAIVNNEVITKAELDAYINIVKLQIGEENWKKSGMTERNILENLVENRLIVQEAKNNKIEVDERTVESRVAKIKSKFSPSEEFSDFLSRQGISSIELGKNIKEQILIDRLISSQIRNRILISPSEVTEYYEANKSKFYYPERANVETIFVSSENVAKEIYKKLENGVDFSQLQKEYSRGGNLGLVARGQLRKEIEDVIFSLEVGKFSKPFEVPEGYYIFLLKEKLSPSGQGLIEVQSAIYNKIWEDKFNAKFKEFIQELKNKSYISIKDEQ